ncbi:MAG: prolyl oligopeptidase family serine peptidase [Thermoanaerobaculaceae bacterium]|nr:prolyl oligopeptidase family serine peptidase [Thermoanaerobaculaceae bacterium]
MLRPTLLAAILMLLPCLAVAAGPSDPYLWLEEVESEKALAWAKDLSRATVAELQKVKEYKPIYARTLEILDARERIPTPGLWGTEVYNFWQDPQHERGILRRTSLESYRTASPVWETVLDIDALVKADGVPWVYKGRTCLGPENRRCMVSLSRGGADATEEREFDLVTRTFVEGGFSVPEAKSSVTWIDADTLWVATDFGAGSLTTSGYPRIVKVWRRGTPLSAATALFEAGVDDMGAWVTSVDTPEGRYNLIQALPTIFTARHYLGVGGRLARLDIPEDAEFQGVFRDRVLFSLRSDWAAGGGMFHQGALLAAGVDSLLQGKPVIEVLFEPSARVSLASVATTSDHVLLTTLDNVRGKLYRLAPGKGGWSREELPLPGLGAVDIKTASETSDVFFYQYQDFLTPASLFLVQGGKSEKVKSLPAFFDATGMRAEQYEATSKDGTRIPYFLITPKGFKADGTAPTLLYGYGGFQNSETPSYGPVLGAAWLERGGVYALANLRGGGEFGPSWHKAAQKENRIKSFEDFIAIAEDLVARRITSPKHLGIEGGSQGGLLVGGAFTMRPDLFGAVVCQVPLLDMQRYHKLLAGASWMAEYGDPDKPEEWSYIQTWSPYQMVRKDVKYPKVFFWTTTRDDRVHPGHARKMVARMLEQGHPVYYYENTEGGHGGGSVNRQKAEIKALEWAYLWKMLR